MSEHGPAPLPAARRRRRSPIGYVIALVVLIGVAGSLLFGNLSSSLVYFVTPTEYQAQSERFASSTLRLGGLVERSDYDPLTNALSFVVTDGNVSYPVQYVGAVPDLFKTGSGVVVEGRFEEGVFHARQLLVKHSEEYSAPKDPSDVRRLLEGTR